MKEEYFQKEKKKSEEKIKDNEEIKNKRRKATNLFINQLIKIFR